MTDRFIVTAGADGALRLWDWDGELQDELDISPARWTALSASPSEDRFVACGEDGDVRVFDVSASQLAHISRWRDRLGWNAVRFSQDGERILSAGHFGIVGMWTDKGVLVRRFAGHGASVRALTVSQRDEAVASTGWDGSVRLWRARAPAHVRQFGLTRVDEKLLTRVGRGGRACLWTPDGTLIEESTNFGRDWYGLGGPSGHPCTFIEPGARTTRVHVVTERGLSEARTVELPGKTWYAAPTRDGSGVVFVLSGRIRRLSTRDPERSEELHVIPDGFGPVRAIHVSSDENLTALAGVGRVAIFERGRPSPLWVDTSHDSVVRCVLFSRDDRWLFTSGSDEFAHRFDARTGERLTTYEGHQAQVDLLDIDPSGTRLATAGQDGTTRIWDLETGTQIRLLRHLDEASGSPCFLADGRRLVTNALDGNMRWWWIEERDIRAAVEASGVPELTDAERRIPELRHLFPEPAK